MLYRISFAAMQQEPAIYIAKKIQCLDDIQQTPSVLENSLWT